jgi:hypothetical protein
MAGSRARGQQGPGGRVGLCNVCRPSFVITWDLLSRSYDNLFPPKPLDLLLIFLLSLLFTRPTSSQCFLLLLLLQPVKRAVWEYLSRFSCVVTRWLPHRCGDSNPTNHNARTWPPLRFPNSSSRGMLASGGPLPRNSG